MDEKSERMKENEEDRKKTCKPTERATKKDDWIVELQQVPITS